MYEPQLDLLACVIVPNLLIHGWDDLVLPSDVVAIYRQQTPGGSVHTFPEPGHLSTPAEISDPQHRPHSPRGLFSSLLDILGHHLDGAGWALFDAKAASLLRGT